MPGSGLVNQGQLDASQISFSSRFNMVLDSFEDPIREIALEIPSTHPIEEHDWIQVIPGLSEWLDDRKLADLVAEGFQIPNKDWSNGIRIHANDIKDDKLGIVRPRIDGLAQKAGLHYGQRIVDALINGFVTTSEFGAAYDGAAFFSAAHPRGDGGGNQSNDAGGALTQATYDAARAAMWSLVDDVGDPLNIVPTHLLVGPSNERNSLEITQAGVIGNPAGTASITNVFAGTARVIVSPRLVGAQAAHWFLMSFATPLRPIILQINEPITSAFVTGDENSSGGQSLQRFMRKQMMFGAHGRHNSGYGLWQTTQGSNA